MTNSEIARCFEHVARPLTEQGANFYRRQAYRRAAETLCSLAQLVEELLRHEGEAGLRAPPGIGEGLARAIPTLVISGQLPVLDQLQGETDSVSLLASVPGIGVTLADRLCHDLGIETLEDLESAAPDGSL